jgi:hypothetical protein
VEKYMIFFRCIQTNSAMSHSFLLNGFRRLFPRDKGDRDEAYEYLSASRVQAKKVCTYHTSS